MMEFDRKDDPVEWLNEPVFTWKAITMIVTFGTLGIGVIVGVMCRVAEWVWAVEIPM
jgi:hypothetical protein